MTGASISQNHHAPASRGEAVRSMSSDELMAGRRMIFIRHGKEEYKPQITAAGKLILTK